MSEKWCEHMDSNSFDSALLRVMTRSDAIRFCPICGKERPKEAHKFCWNCGNDYLNDPKVDCMDACCYRCHAPYDKRRCEEFNFKPKEAPRKLAYVLKQNWYCTLPSGEKLDMPCFEQLAEAAVKEVFRMIDECTAQWLRPSTNTTKNERFISDEELKAKLREGL